MIDRRIPITGPFGQRFVLKRANSLYIFFSRGGDCPERILVSKMVLTENWKEWQPSEPIELLRPETEFEGGNLPLCPSSFEAANEPLNELRDPAIYEENEKSYLMYTGAGEANICGAELICEGQQPAILPSNGLSNLIRV